MQKLNFKTSMFRSETQRSDFHSINGLERLSVVYFDQHSECMLVKICLYNVLCAKELKKLEKARKLLKNLAKKKFLVCTRMLAWVFSGNKTLKQHSDANLKKKQIFCLNFATNFMLFLYFQLFYTKML